MAKAKSLKMKPLVIDPMINPSDFNQPEFTWELNSDVISVDGGNGKVSAWRLVDGKLQHLSLPTVRVPLRNTKLSSDVTVGGVAEITKVEFLKSLYGVGDQIWELSDYAVETFSNSQMRYGSDHYLCMVLSTIALMGVDEDAELTLIVSAPPGLVNEVAKDIKAAFLAGESGLGDGWWSIRLGNERSAREFRVKKVLVVPEGVNAYAAYAYDANGNNVAVKHPKTGHDLLTGNVFIADGGMGTFDGFFIRNGVLNEQSIEHATDAGGGIQAHLIMPLMDHIRAEFEKAKQPQPQLNQAQIDSWLRQWSLGDKQREAANVLLNGLQLNLHTAFARFSQKYAHWIITEKLEPAFRRGADTILAVGGAWVYTLDTILEAYPNRNILHPGKVDHVKHIPLWELNGYGGLPMAANNKKVHRKVKA